jgi:hypothetical protein
MSWKLSIATGLLLVTLPNLYAQTAADAPATREDVMKFLEVTQAKSRVEQVLAGMARQARVSAEEGFKQRIPDATPEQLSRVDALADSIFKNFSPDEFVEAIVPIYQRHLTKSDLDAILAFYASPAGQKLQKETPAIMSESMEAGGEIARKKMSAINQKIETQIDDMAREEQKKKNRGLQTEPAKN